MSGSMVRRLDRVVVRDSVQEVNVQVSADLQQRSDAGDAEGSWGGCVLLQAFPPRGQAQLLSPQLYHHSHETPMSCFFIPSDVLALGEHHLTSTQ